MYRLIKKKRLEIELKFANDELLEVYENLAKSDEELRIQYHQLEETRKTIEKNEERYRLLSEATDDGFWDLDITTNEIFANEKLSKVLGIDSEDAKQYIYNLEEHVHPKNMPLVNSIIDNLKSGKNDNYTIEYKSKDKYGRYRWILAKGRMLKDKDNNPIRVSGFHIDIEDRKNQEEQIETLAYFDNVTKLPNRAKFYKVMNEIFESSDQKDASGLVLYMDIDNFKIINDTFGHEFGDMVLKMVADRLKYMEVEPRKVFRLSGDEYVVILPSYSADRANEAATRVQDIMSNAFMIDDNEIQISMSIGLVNYPKDGNNVDELLRKSDLAMYKAKELGKNQYKLYESSLEDEITDRLILENHLRNALGRGEFVLNYQPQINTITRDIIGFEALIRWYSPEYGYVSPMKFIPVAEDMGLINKIGEWILKEACEFSIRVNEKFKKKIVVSINISPIQLNQDNFTDILKKVIEDTNVKTDQIGVEITETSLMERFNENAKKLEEIRNMGIEISLDDFGTGYSSLNYLMKLPIHTIKIDRSFIVNMTSDTKGIKIIESIITLAHNMGLSVVAEGVETNEQLDILHFLKCDVIQGYIFGKPLSEEDSFHYIGQSGNKR